MKARGFLLLFLLFTEYITHAQTIIHGRVIDKVTREPLEMAVITDVRTRHHTLTDQTGRFSLHGVVLPAELEISIIGYAAQKVSATSADAALLTVPLDKGIFNL